MYLVKNENVILRFCRSSTLRSLKLAKDAYQFIHFKNIAEANKVTLKTFSELDTSSGFGGIVQII